MNEQARIHALLAEATVDCFDDEVEFGGVLGTLEDHLVFPLQARALGETVTVVGLAASAAVCSVLPLQRTARSVVAMRYTSLWQIIWTIVWLPVIGSNWSAAHPS